MTRSSPRSKRRTRLMGSGTWLTIYNSRPALRRRDVWNAGRPQGRQKTMATQERGLRRTVNPDRLYEPETSGSTRPWKRHFRRATHWRYDSHRRSPGSSANGRLIPSCVTAANVKASRSLTRIFTAGSRRPDALPREKSRIPRGSPSRSPARTYTFPLRFARTVRPHSQNKQWQHELNGRRPLR